LNVSIGQGLHIGFQRAIQTSRYSTVVAAEYPTEVLANFVPVDARPERQIRGKQGGDKVIKRMEAHQ